MCPNCRSVYLNSIQSHKQKPLQPQWRWILPTTHAETFSLNNRTMSVTWKAGTEMKENQTSNSVWYQAKGIQSKLHATINQTNPSYHSVHPSIQGKVKQRQYLLPTTRHGPNLIEILLVITASYRWMPCVSFCKNVPHSFYNNLGTVPLLSPQRSKYRYREDPSRRCVLAL